MKEGKIEVYDVKGWARFSSVVYDEIVRKEGFHYQGSDHLEILINKTNGYLKISKPLQPQLA